MMMGNRCLKSLDDAVKNVLVIFFLVFLPEHCFHFHSGKTESAVALYAEDSLFRVRVLAKERCSDGVAKTYAHGSESSCVQAMSGQVVEQNSSTNVHGVCTFRANNGI